MGISTVSIQYSLRKSGSDMGFNTKVTVEMKGLDILLRQLQGLPDKLGDKLVRQAMRDGGNVMRDYARRTPVFKDVTGALRKSIRVSVARKVKGLVVLGSVRAGGKKLPYASMVEFGTKKMGARPFMRTSFSSQGGVALNVMVGSMRSRFDDTVKDRS